MLRAFNEDPAYLVRYYLRCTVGYAALVALIFWLTPWNFGGSKALWMAALLPLLFNSVLGMVGAALLCVILCAILLGGSHGGGLTGAHLLLVPAGVYFGMVAVQLIHNCAHRSFRPRWLNRVLGEVLAIHLLSGFPGFTIIHLHHHRHADDPRLDPHPNENLGFFQYFLSVKGKLRAHFRRIYFEKWGERSDAKRLWALGQALLPLNRVLRAWLLLALAGPVGFTLFFIPSFIANHVTFAHINYFTHAKQPDGSVEIINLHEGWVYRILNLVMIGGYFHRNHHRAPWLFNPARLDTLARSPVEEA